MVAFKSKNAARRAAKKQQKASGDALAQKADVQVTSDEPHAHGKSSLLDDIASMPLDGDLSDFKAAFQRMATEDVSTSSMRLISSHEKGQRIYDDDAYIPDEGYGDDSEPEEKQVSKSRQKKASRLNVAELKQLVNMPEVVEWFDVSAPDPKLLVTLKSVRNVVPVPGHWSQKREYLAGKRGMEQSRFELPDFIRATGVGEMRQAAQDEREGASLKQQMRQRVQPKMGRLDIDYQKLHDAFFRFQTKPHMTQFGETYFEGKEMETNTREKRPGHLSEELKDALSIPPGAPPPWLINMQRFGPPPSYPSLKIAGLNAPIPSGAQWGYHPGGWGKPPTDEYNRPLYGDVFGMLQPPPRADLGVRKEIEHWGELEEVVEEEAEEEEEDEEEEEEMEDKQYTVSGLETPSGTQSVASAGFSGLETPDHIELRKSRYEENKDRARRGRREPSPDLEDVNRPKTLYQVLPEKQEKVKGFYGSSHGYAMPDDTPPVPAATPRAPWTQDVIPTLGTDQPTKKRHVDDVNLAVDPEQLEKMSKEELSQVYDQARSDRIKPANWDNDLSDMVNENVQAQQTKRQKRPPPAEAKKKFKF